MTGNIPTVYLGHWRESGNGTCRMFSFVVGCYAVGSATLDAIRKLHFFSRSRLKKNTSEFYPMYIFWSDYSMGRYLSRPFAI